MRIHQEKALFSEGGLADKPMVIGFDRHTAEGGAISTHRHMKTSLGHLIPQKGDSKIRPSNTAPRK